MIAITLENFQQIVLEESKSKLVLVAFWAQQIPESVELKDKLTVKTAPYAEQILMATVDCETQQQIAQQFGIQGLPTAVLVQDGQPIDGVSGPQTDETIATFLDKHLPKQEDTLLAQAKLALTENNITEAQNLITQAYQLDEQRADIKLTLIDIHIQTGKIEAAQTLLDSIKMVDQDSYYQALLAKLELANQAANSPEIQVLEKELADNPNDISIQHQLASQYSQVNRHEDALKILFRLVQAGEATTKDKSKELFLDVLKSLPDGDIIATKYRRKLYTLLY
ncbi:tetratricopeptide repeat protein [Colwellia sp. 4_MG-2023]|jgi:putative thioredoxin|uniref:tetratricopeptide repeat protein n=1 Tax=unclassified Colwellia TaxID=196834 RepID=UPI001C0A57C4|nr:MULTISPECIES: tetratricopeptide repeat protein [unclassified Colwellia]MBU2926258.1 tetratricopeptide repeat protein [Colwellia sp. C2M11]MDO6508505.1 tetratricopeptide repeat protein [Colwellia sp. 5_MG-2023]MDO6557120.1 tetratricopeptide repeat protein [Colwellia sp. 4_MG-2023]MDO6652320.1 tetratricopeptide repeat protein [Colwellia sp. 3_MG-2023]MDO6666920.1 tetratricopeptide repeat protein [Colwellia sp. 2_MG-2023]